MTQFVDRTKAAFQVVREPVDFVSNLFTILTFLAPLPAFFFGYGALEQTAVGRGAPGFPLRLLMLVLCASVLGWGLGFFIRLATRQNSSGMAVLAVVVSALWALLLVVVAEALSIANRSFPEFSLFLFVGIGLVLWLMIFQLRANVSQTSAVVVLDRARMALWFVMTALSAAALIQFAGAA